jgi:hypothetical protein
MMVMTTVASAVRATEAGRLSVALTPNFQITKYLSYFIENITLKIFSIYHDYT